MKICLDAGHGYKGSSHTGAAGNGLVEDDIAYDFVTRVGHHLREYGCDTVITRPTSKFVSLGSRGALAKSKDCDFFISFHCNAGSPLATGVEAYVALNDFRSLALAKKLLAIITAGGSIKSRGAKWDNQSQHNSLRVLRDTYRKMPAMLVEMGFLSNISDAKLLGDRTWREAMSIKIAKKLIELGEK